MNYISCPQLLELALVLHADLYCCSSIRETSRNPDGTRRSILPARPGSHGPADATVSGFSIRRSGVVYKATSRRLLQTASGALPPSSPSSLHSPNISRASPMRSLLLPRPREPSCSQMHTRHISSPCPARHLPIAEWPLLRPFHSLYASHSMMGISCTAIGAAPPPASTTTGATAAPTATPQLDRNQPGIQSGSSTGGTHFHGA